MLLLLGAVVPFYPYFTSAQSFLILQPTSTPSSIDVEVGPPPPNANLTAQPLPELPDPALGTSPFTINLSSPDPSQVFQSIPLPPNFLGVSLELSVADDFLGTEIGEPHYQLLNYLANIKARAGVGVVLRIGGNTQDTAAFNESFNGIIAKSGGGYSPEGIPITPTIQYSSSIFELTAQVAHTIDARIIWGVNMVNNTASFTIPMVSAIKEKLGPQLLMLLVSFLAREEKRTQTDFKPLPEKDYFNEWSDLTDRIIQADYHDNPKQFVGPGVCCEWNTSQVIDEGYVDRFSDRLRALSGIKYPQSVCGKAPDYGRDGYLSQDFIVGFAQYDIDAIAFAVSKGIPYWIVETNTASCIGIADVSDTFTSTIWAINYALQKAYRNTTGVLLHNGGQQPIYNIFTPPAYNSSVRSWRTGPIYYSLLVVAEALRPKITGAAVTLTDQWLPHNRAAAYNVYENGVVGKMVLINMLSDPSGKNDLQINIPQPPGTSGALPYKLLAASSVAEKVNITWAGQTCGYYSDGILRGNETIMRAPCENGNCVINVPAPGVALVFLSTDGPSMATVTSSAFPPVGTQNAQIVLSSNGGRGHRGGSTSKGSLTSSAAALIAKAQEAAIFTSTALLLFAIVIFLTIT